MSELRNRAALKVLLTPVTMYNIAPGQAVRVYRERSRRWKGPFSVKKVSGKQVWITDGFAQKQLNCAQLLPDPADEADREMARLLKGFRALKTGGVPGIKVMDTVQAGNRKNDDPSFDSVKAKELFGLPEKDNLEILNEKDFPKDANVLGGRFVLATKIIKTHNSTPKARFVVQGHRDLEKHLLVHSSNYIRQHSVRILVTIAAIHGFHLWSKNVSQAYLEARDGLKRYVHILEPLEFQLGP